MLTQKAETLLKSLIWLLIAFRLASLPFNFITDATESRYAEIGRKMWETGNFTTPFIDYGVPFWGKPPLSFWTTAISYAIFGVNEFAARLPSFLFSLGAIGLAYSFAARYFSREVALVAALVSLTCTVFFYLMAGSMTDMALNFAVVLAMVSFWNAMHAAEGHSRWGYCLFAALGLCLLAKGPIGVVFAGLACGAWIALRGEWASAWRRIPWFSGTALMFAIAAPWYVLAEIRTPGFLRYFIVGEHFERYFVPEWSGDLYGQGRGGFHGVIWLYSLACLLPWTVYVLARLFDAKFRKVWAGSVRDERRLFLLLWIVLPTLFFTFSGNVILTYGFYTVLPAAALLADAICRSEGEGEGARALRTGKFVAAAAFNLLVLTGLFAFPAFDAERIKSKKFLVEKYYSERSADEPLLYFNLKRNRYSLAFYSNGTAKKIADVGELRARLSESASGAVFVILDEGEPARTDFGGLKVEPLLEHMGRVLARVRV